MKKDTFKHDEKIILPEPKYNSSTSVEMALLERRSIREYKEEPLTLFEIAQLLWSAQGRSNQKINFRTTPSAGALYPLELYVVIGNVEGVTKGVYRYNCFEHELLKVREGDVRDDLTIATLGQTCVRDGAVDFVFSAVFERITQKYGDRGIRYVCMEAGHAAQNIYLQVVSLKMATVVLGAFRDEKVKKILTMPDEEVPLYIMPIGKL